MRFASPRQCGFRFGVKPDFQGEHAEQFQVDVLGADPTIATRSRPASPMRRRRGPQSFPDPRGRYETARRLRSTCGMVFRYAIVTGRAERDPSIDLRGALTAPKVIHRAAIVDPAGIGALFRAIEDYEGLPLTKAALLLAPLVFVRPGELRKAEWAEFDLEQAKSRIPAAKMKMRRLHRVLLSNNRLGLFVTCRHSAVMGGGYSHPCAAFPGRCPKIRLNAALRRLGYSKGQIPLTASKEWPRRGLKPPRKNPQQNRAQSGGARDSFGLAVAHRDGDGVVVDCVRETRPPFLPEAGDRRVRGSAEVLPLLEGRGRPIWRRVSARAVSEARRALRGQREDEKRALCRFLADAQFGQRDCCRARTGLSPSSPAWSAPPPAARARIIDHPRDQHDDLANVVAGAATLARSHGGYLEALARACRDDDAPDEPTWADKERQRRYDELMRRYGRPLSVGLPREPTG